MNKKSLLDIFASPRQLLSANEAAEYLGVVPGSLAVWRSTGRYALPWVAVGRLVKYRLQDLDLWLASRTRASGATA